jgi:hypothetical protein
MSYDVALGINTPFLNQLLDQITKVIFHPQESDAASAALVAGRGMEAEESTGDKIKKLLAEYMPPVVSLESPNLVAYFAKGGQPTVPGSTSWPTSGIFLCISPPTTEEFANTVLPIGKDLKLEKFGVGVSATVSADSVSGFAVTPDGYIAGMVNVSVNDISIHFLGSHNIGSFSEAIPIVLKPSISDNKLYIELYDIKLPEPNLHLPGILKSVEHKIIEVLNDIISDVMNWIMSKINPVYDFGTITVMGDIGVDINSLETAAVDSYLLANAKITVVEKSVAV